ncbi:MAG TPA: 6-pyruvoyl tetrahydrobiopterin synthase [Flavobacteriales bacterium]|mgnify:CR=1 FL=1|jgi:6-pyruvoyltetrahydropterin/6-carboxytetrahydropterin synthase|nr:6-carboxytetrahydropterin synthase [Salibacteraceae bacterium]HAS36940.1 6-pyruvoyl tetrahydrobiopterin synthase [Flavobacteriales bacterium]
MKMKVFRRETFNAAHRLYNPNWTDEQNEATFGKCNNPNWHGHNYVIIAEVEGEINPDTGYVVDMKILKKIMQEEVCEIFDHKNLNLDVREMQNIIPTAENICVVAWNLIRNKLDTKLNLKIRLYETERNFVEYDGNV